MKDYCKPGGLLQEAFHTINDNLPWFNVAANLLLLSALQSILLAQHGRMMCWQVLAVYQRVDARILDYNNAVREAFYAQQEMSDQLAICKKRVESKITDMLTFRDKSISIKWDQQDNNQVERWLNPDMKPDRHFAGFVHDPVSGRDIGRSELSRDLTVDEVRAYEAILRSVRYPRHEHRR